MTADFGAVSIPMTLSRSDKIDKDIWKKIPAANLLRAGPYGGYRRALAQQIVGSGDVSSRTKPVITNPPSPFDSGNSITIGEAAQGTLTISNGGNEFLGSENPIGGNKTSFIAAEFDSAADSIDRRL